MCIAMNVQDSRTGLIKRRYSEQHLETWLAGTLSGFFWPLPRAASI
jgi:hypothetical protein